jgi:hypothetical protein
LGAEPCTACGLKKSRLPDGISAAFWRDASKQRGSVKSGASCSSP